jgi:hypothetical protein
VNEEKYSEIYAHLCEKILNKFPFVTRRVIERCENELLNSIKTDITSSNEMNNDSFLFDKKKLNLGNIRFISELFKMKLISDDVIINYLDQLSENEENIEYLCYLLKNSGECLDFPIDASDQKKRILRSKMNGYFKKLTHSKDRIKRENEYSIGINKSAFKMKQRIYFMIFDLIDLRGVKFNFSLIYFIIQYFIFIYIQ